MTGAYLRVERDGVWQEVEVEYLSNKEREVALANADVMQWLHLMSDALESVCPWEEEK